MGSTHRFHRIVVCSCGKHHMPLTNGKFKRYEIAENIAKIDGKAYLNETFAFWGFENSRGHMLRFRL